MQRRLFLGTLFFASIVACPDGGVDEVPVPTAFDCANAVQFGTLSLQAPLAGKLLVRVETLWQGSLRTDTPPLAGALVRVEKDGRRFEATTPANGCVEFEDPALVPPLTVHAFSMSYGYTTYVADPRRIQTLGVRVFDPVQPPIDDPPPPVAYVFGSITGTAQITEPPRGYERYVGAVAGAQNLVEANWNRVVTEPGNYELQVPENTPLTVLAAGGYGFEGFEEDQVYMERYTHLGVGTAPAVALGSSQEVNIALDVAIDHPLHVTAPALPASSFGSAYTFIELELPNGGPAMTLDSTSALSADLLAVELTAPLPNGTMLRGGAGMHENYADPEFGFRNQEVMQTRTTSGDFQVPAWINVKSRMSYDARGARIDVEGVDYCRLTMTGGGWRFFSFAPPWDAEYPELPAGFEDAARERTGYSAYCVRVQDGFEPYDIEAPVEATLQDVLSVF